MAEYVLVEDGEITEYHGALPQSWRNISGLNLAADDVDFLTSVGWYPVQKVWVDYNSETHRVSSYSYEIHDKYVTETPVLESIPESEIPTFEQKKTEFLAQLRFMRLELLKDSDWTQLPDSPISEEIKVRWKTYRQALRDLPDVYSTDSTLDINQIIWPVF